MGGEWIKLPGFIEQNIQDFTPFGFPFIGDPDHHVWIFDDLKKQKQLPNMLGITLYFIFADIV